MELSLGQRITHYRKKAGISQKNLAAIIGITPTALNYYEKNKCEPNILVLTNLAKALKVSGDALLGLEPRSDLVAQNRDEYAVLRDFRALNDVARERVLDYLSAHKELPRYVKFM